jgi:hypothetical protein
MLARPPRGCRNTGGHDPVHHLTWGQYRVCSAEIPVYSRSMRRAGTSSWPVALVLLCWACSAPKVEGGGGAGGSSGAGAGAGAGSGGASPGTAGAGGTAPTRPGAGRARLEVTPENDVLMVDRGQTATRTFTVTLVRADGSTADVTAQARLTSDNPQAGALAGATFRSVAMTTNNVAFTRVDATYDEGGQTFRGRANLTLVWLRASGDSQDFFFTLPFMGPIERKDLSFTTLIQSLDVFFAVDTTASMGGPIGNLRASLRDTIIPAVKKAAVRDAWFGVGAVEDFPVMPYGVPGFMPPAIDDQPFILIAPMTGDVTAAQAAIEALILPRFLPSIIAPRGAGGDQPEAHLEALYQVATGDGLMVPGVASVPPHKGRGKGGVEFREGAQPVVVTISDVPSHTKDEPDDRCQTNYAGPVAQAAHTRAQTEAALAAVCAKVIGIATMWPANAYKGPTCTPAVDMTRLAQATGALVPPEAWDVPARPAGCAAGRCCTGQNGAGEAPDAAGLCPLVFKNDTKGTGVGDQVTAGITQLARFGAFDLVATTDGDPLPMGRTTAAFIRSVVPRDVLTPPPPPANRVPMIQGGKFTGVLPGAVVRFTIEAKNDVVMEQPQPQVFHARIKIRAGGCADLDERDVIILVPPSKPVIE